MKESYLLFSLWITLTQCFTPLATEALEAARETTLLVNPYEVLMWTIKPVQSDLISFVGIKFVDRFVLMIILSRLAFLLV